MRINQMKIFNNLHLLLLFVQSMAFVCCAYFAIYLFDAQAATHSNLPENNASLENIYLERISETYIWHLSSPGRDGTNLVDILLTDKYNNPVKGKNMIGNLWMPEMPMNGYPVDLYFTDVDGTGIYGCIVQYVHGGLWRIAVKVNNDEGKIENVEFDVMIED